MASVGMTFKPSLMKIYRMVENIIGDGVKHNETIFIYLRFVLTIRSTF
jgi:hypothetical protein